jgi:hypothetical protein
MCVEIGTEAAKFPEKEYINGIFVAVLVYRSLELFLNVVKLQYTEIIAKSCFPQRVSIPKLESAVQKFQGFTTSKRRFKT